MSDAGNGGRAGDVSAAPSPATLAAATARLLAAGRVAAAVSALAVVVAAGALLAGGAPPALVRASPWCWWSVAAAGVPAAWLAWRAELDAGLFGDLARALATDTPPAALAALDAALRGLGLGRGAPAAGRGLDECARGARRLVVRQALLALVQALAVVALMLPRPG